VHALSDTTQSPFIAARGGSAPCWPDHAPGAQTAGESAPWNADGNANPPPGAHEGGEPGTHEVYRLQRAVRGLLRDHRVSYCLRQPRHDRVEVRAHRDGDGCRCSYRGLARCSDVWGCPVCGRMISRERAREVDTAVTHWLDQGGAVALLTLTMPHVAADSLGQLIDWLGNSLQRTKRGAPWKRMVAQFGIAGAITTKEATWGVESGWHPHFHLVLLVSADAAAERMEAKIGARWARMVEKVCGRAPNEHGCRVSVRADQDAPAAAAGYLTKGAWSVGREVEGGASKEAKHGRFTPLDICRRYADALEEGDQGGQRYWGALFRGYVEAYRGRQQTVWTPGLKARFGVRDLDEQEAADGEGESESETIAVIGKRGWECVREHAAEGALLRLAEQYGYEGVRDWLARHGWDVGRTDMPMFEALGGASPPCAIHG